MNNNENYVSFETTKLLKEKGFDEYTLGYYLENKDKLDFDRFSDYVEAMIDAVRNGEDIDRVVSLVFCEKVDQPIVKMKLIKLMNDSNYECTRI
jgi:hypothetical protein